MKASTTKLRMLESDTIGSFVTKTLGRIRSTAAAIEQGAGNVFTPIDQAIGVVSTVEADLLSRVGFLKKELEKFEMKA